jgi:hypothetical protein
MSQARPGEVRTHRSKTSGSDVSRQLEPLCSVSDIDCGDLAAIDAF